MRVCVQRAREGGGGGAQHLAEFRFLARRATLIHRPRPRPPTRAKTGMNSLFYADGAFFERIYAFLKQNGREDKAKMIRRALFVHQ